MLPQSYDQIGYVHFSTYFDLKIASKVIDEGYEQFILI